MQDQSWTSALRQQDPSATKLLLEGGGVNDRSKFGQTRLHYAAFAGLNETLERLISAGADVNALDNFGNSPLIFAVDQKHADTARILLDSGADPRVRAKNGETPLLLAIFLKDPLCVQVLTSLEVSLDEQDEKSYAPVKIGLAHMRRHALVMNQ